MQKKKANVVFFDSKPYDIQSFQSKNEPYGFNLKFFEQRLTEDSVRLAEGYDAVCAFVNDHLNAAVLNRLQALGIGLVAMRCAGYNNVDLQAAFKKICIVRVPAYSPHAVAEHAAALLFTLNRKIHKAYSRTREGNFSLHGLMGMDLCGKVAGVIGTGKIGKIFIQILRGVGMTIYAYDLHPDKAFADANGITYTDLKTIYEKSDVISLHCPLTQESHHIIRQESLSQMKPGVLIINTSRGQLIHTTYLIEALKNGTVGGAGLDVYEEEDKYFFQDFSAKPIEDDTLARLLNFPNVVVTSHQAFFTKEAMDNIAATTLESIQSFFDGKALPNEICYSTGS